jgi:hypothetical protein
MTRRALLFALAGLALLLVAVVADVAQGQGGLSLHSVVDALLQTALRSRARSSATCGCHVRWRESSRAAPSARPPCC